MDSFFVLVFFVLWMRNIIIKWSVEWRVALYKWPVLSSGRVILQLHRRIVWISSRFVAKLLRSLFRWRERVKHRLNGAHSCWPNLSPNYSRHSICDQLQMNSRRKKVEVLYLECGEGCIIIPAMSHVLVHIWLIKGIPLSIMSMDFSTLAVGFYHMNINVYEFIAWKPIIPHEKNTPPKVL